MTFVSNLAALPSLDQNLSSVTPRARHVTTLMRSGLQTTLRTRGSPEGMVDPTSRGAIVFLGAVREVEMGGKKEESHAIFGLLRDPVGNW